jgi:hypothetical protein
MSVEYRMNVGAGSGVEQLLRSAEMSRFMVGVAQRTADVARAYASPPGAIRVMATTGFRGRQAANVVNTAPRALMQEYGPLGRPQLALRPLNHALDWLRSQDPNRKLSRR